MHVTKSGRLSVISLQKENKKASEYVEYKGFVAWSSSAFDWMWAGSLNAAVVIRVLLIGTYWCIFKCHILPLSNFLPSGSMSFTSKMSSNKTPAILTPHAAAISARRSPFSASWQELSQQGGVRRVINLNFFRRYFLSFEMKPTKHFSYYTPEASVELLKCSIYCLKPRGLSPSILPLSPSFKLFVLVVWRRAWVELAHVRRATRWRTMSTKRLQKNIEKDKQDPRLTRKRPRSTNQAQKETQRRLLSTHTWKQRVSFTANRMSRRNATTFRWWTGRRSSLLPTSSRLSGRPKWERPL